MNALSELLPVASKHELEQLSDTLCVLANLAPSTGVEDRKTRVDMPLVAVDAKGDVHLHVLDAANVARDLPGELLVCFPRRAHRQESGVGDCLRVRGDAVVHLGGEVYMLGLEAAEDALDKVDGLLRATVVDDYERLAFRIDTRTVERMARHDLNIGGQVLLKSLNLGSLGRSLATDDSTLLGGRAKTSDDGINTFSFDAVHNPVTAARHEMTIFEDCDIFLLNTQHTYYITKLSKMGHVHGVPCRKTLQQEHRTSRVCRRRALYHERSESKNWGVSEALSVCVLLNK